MKSKFFLPFCELFFGFRKTRKTKENITALQENRKEARVNYRDFWDNAIISEESCENSGEEEESEGGSEREEEGKWEAKWMYRDFSRIYETGRSYLWRILRTIHSNSYHVLNWLQTFDLKLMKYIIFQFHLEKSKYGT